MAERGLAGRPCTASTTHDLLDCDCGYITDHMKFHLLRVREQHTLYVLDTELTDSEPGPE